MSTQTVERPVQTCVTCPFFNPESGVYGWCGAFDRMAKPHHERTTTCDQEIAAQEEAEEHYPTRQSQAVDEYQQGLVDAQRDAQERLHPIYEKNLHEYARGYVQGYQTILKPFDPTSQPFVTELRTEWAVVLDSRWGVYQAWVGDRCIGHGATEEEAERKARNYIAIDELIQKQNAVVRDAYLAAVV